MKRQTVPQTVVKYMVAPGDQNLYLFKIIIILWGMVGTK